MSRKSKSRRESENQNNDAAQAVRDSAQKIWLAGLGAFERAKTDGPRMFETLVEQGRNMGAKAIGAADDALKSMREGNYGQSPLGKLEQAVEERIAKSLSRFSALSGREVEELSRQVQELNESVRNLMSGNAGGGSGGSRSKRAATGSRKAGTTGGRKKAASKTSSRGTSGARGGARSSSKSGAKAGSRKASKASSGRGRKSARTEEA